MTGRELQRLLRARFPVENERHEWKGWRNLKHNISGARGEDLLSYVSALANMDGGSVVIGAEDGSLEPIGIADSAGYTAADLPHRLLGRCAQLPSIGLHVEVLEAADPAAIVWVVHVPRHLPRQPVVAHGQGWQRDHDKLVPLRPDRHAAILAEPLVGEDWSAMVVEGATLADLDRDALTLARQQFGKKFAAERWVADLPRWSDTEFLDKAKLTIHGAMTRSALLLLGRTEGAHWLTPHPAEISWKLPDERVIEHFGPPFVLTTTAVMSRIRNPIIKLFPEAQLIPVQLPRYDTQLVLEALHNCIAHQDYARGERVVVEERVASLRLENAGGFIEGQPEDFFAGTRTPRLYRNPWLATAMNNIGMIDKGGFGIRDMLEIQRKRALPLPDYAGSSASQTVFNVLGHTLSAEYSQLLRHRPDLDLADVLLLDRLQKGQELNLPQRKALRAGGLIEGRGKRVTISAGVAKATGRETEYVGASGLGTEYFRAMVLKLLALGPQPRSKIDGLLLAQVPAAVVGAARRKAYLKQLLQEMARRGEIVNVGGATRAARWALTAR